MMIGALAEGFLEQGAVLLRIGLELQFRVAAVAVEGAVRLQFHISCRKNLAVGKLLEHVHMVHAPWKDEGDCLAGEIFNNKVFHHVSAQKPQPAGRGGRAASLNWVRCQGMESRFFVQEQEGIAPLPPRPAPAYWPDWAFLRFLRYCCTAILCSRRVLLNLCAPPSVMATK